MLPVQASSVPCERLFSSSKQVATDRRARLGSERFEEILIMRSAWRGSVTDWASVNSNDVEEIDLVEYGELLEADAKAQVCDLEDEAFEFESDIN